MKIIKIYKSYAVLFFSILFLSSCSKDSVEINEDNSATNGLKIVNYHYSIAGKRISKTRKGFSGTTIAVFDTKQNYNNYVEDLETQVENWDDTFLTQWSHLNDDDLNAKEEALNFDSEKPLTDFENQNGLQSLRQKYLDEEKAWLNNDVLDVRSNPDNKPEYDFDSHEMSVLNSLAEVQIGSTITKQLSSNEIELINSSIQKGSSKRYKAQIMDDARLIIKDADYNALIDFNNGDVSVIDNDNVTVTNSSSTTTCRYSREQRKDFTISSNKKFIMAVIKVRPPTLGYNGKIKTKIKSYKKGLFGWRKWRTKIDAGARGNVYNTNCNNSPTYINKWRGVKRRKKRIFKWRNNSFGSHKVENGGMAGLYKHNNVVKELALTW